MYKFINVLFFITTSLLKPVQSFKIIIGLYVAYLVDLSVGYGSSCEDIDYTPTNGYRNPNYQPGHYYREDKVIHFNCYQNYVPANGSALTCRQYEDGSTGWWPSEYPTCISMNAAEAIKPCLRPKNPKYGTVLCCENGPDSKYCCEYGFYAQFTCKEGYTLQSGSSQWKCGHDGKWKDPQTEKPQSTRHPPACVKEMSPEIPPQVGAIQLSSDMLTTLIGVAVGVLSLLLLVIILAFCKPRLKDIKRRWRDLREDENRLVVNGQEVHLPSYDEAILPDQEQWTEPILPASSMLNSLSRPDFSSLETHQAFLHSRQLQNITLPPVSNLQGSSASYDEQQPCCSRSLLDITTSSSPSAVGQPRPNSLSSSTSSAGGGFNAFHSFLLPSTSSTNAANDQVAGGQAAATALAGSSSCNTITTLVIDCEQFDCLDEQSQPPPSSQMQSTSSAPDAATAQDSSSLLLDSSNLTTSMVADDSLNDPTNFDDNFVTNAIEPLPPSSPADKAVQPNISFFSVLAPDIQLEGGGDSTEGGPEAKKTETKWTRF